KVDATRDFLLEWEQVIDRTPHDFLIFHVVDSDGSKIFDSGDLVMGQNTLTIPAGTLQPDRTYTGYFYLNHYSKVSKGENPPHWLTAETRGTQFAIKTLNPAGIFRFLHLSVIAMKTNDAAVMTVERGDGAQGDVTVDYYSADGTAIGYTDYL